jgi:hypothetical protein
MTADCNLKDEMIGQIRGTRDWRGRFSFPLSGIQII